eukprot:PhF_6_TR13349/c2_g2_i1/m.21142
MDSENDTKNNNPLQIGHVESDLTVRDISDDHDDFIPSTSMQVASTLSPSQHTGPAKRSDTILRDIFFHVLLGVTICTPVHFSLHKYGWHELSTRAQYANVTFDEFETVDKIRYYVY